jgi:hypothetical protein
MKCERLMARRILRPKDSLPALVEKGDALFSMVFPYLKSYPILPYPARLFNSLHGQGNEIFSIFFLIFKAGSTDTRIRHETV